MLGEGMSEDMSGDIRRELCSIVARREVVE